MGRCSTCNGPTCGNCLECHNPDCKDGVKEATDPRGQCHYKGKPIPIRKSAFDKAWGIAKAADWDTSFNFKENREKAKWSQEDIDRLNARNDKAREALRNRTPLPTRSNGNALDRALSRARRENAKPKPKMRITRPEDWE